MPLFTLTLFALLVALGGLSPAKGQLDGDLRDTLEEEPSRFGRTQEGGRENFPVEELTGYTFVPEGYPMDGSALSEADLSEMNTASKSKRVERCYCDLDLFCKRFGCRRRKRVTDVQHMRSRKSYPSYPKSDVILRLVQKLIKQNERSFRSQQE